MRETNSKVRIPNSEFDLAGVLLHGRGGVTPGQLVLVGFSQGACLAVEYALRHPGRCGTLVVLRRPDRPPGTAWPTVDLRGTRVLITGSDVDAWVPESRVRETARVLQHLGADGQLRIYTGRPHIVSDDEIAEARAFVTSCPRPGGVTAVETSP